jgi:two-component system response regulator HydG
VDSRWRSAMNKILVVDDQRNMRTTLALILRGAGYEVAEAENAIEACELAAENYDVIITDLRMGATTGFDVLHCIKEASANSEVIVMTAYGTIESAVEAMRLGAFDYIQKPFHEDELLARVGKAIEKRRLSQDVAHLTSEFKDRYQLGHIVGRSPAIRDLLARTVRIAPTDAIVLITGESGTGKELVAKAIHANSKRASRPFIPVNCAAITETLLESELFGHARGAFTGAAVARKGLFEEADGGTFFFDEIAETPLTFQAKLLRAIQEREIRRVGENKPVTVDVRIIAATNQDLLTAVAEKRFRQDLYYRLNVARLLLPPLRERREDIPILLSYFLDKYNRKMSARARFHEGVFDALTQYDFPGNVRELEHMIEQAVALVNDGLICADDLLPATSTGPSEGKSGSSRPPRLLAGVADQAERSAIERALSECEGNRAKAAELLGISPTTLWRKMTRMKITFETKI